MFGENLQQLFQSVDHWMAARGWTTRLYKQLAKIESALWFSDHFIKNIENNTLWF